MAKVATRGGWFSVSFGAYKGQGVTRESVRAAAVDAMSASVRMAAAHRSDLDDGCRWRTDARGHG